MLKRISIVTTVLVFAFVLGMNVVAAQPLEVQSCDPYAAGQSSFSISVSDLTVPTTTTGAAGNLGINPDVLTKIADNVTGIQSNTATFANPQTDLAPDAYATVTPDGNNLKLYEGTCLESSVITQFTSGTRVTVLDGPIAAEGMAWWRVRHSGMTGWVIEGQDTAIWLQGSR